MGLWDLLTTALAVTIGIVVSRWLYPPPLPPPAPRLAIECFQWGAMGGALLDRVTLDDMLRNPSKRVLVVGDGIVTVDGMPYYVSSWP